MTEGASDDDRGAGRGDALGPSGADPGARPGQGGPNGRSGADARPGLPLDSDAVENDLPPHLRLGYLALVAGGGAVGTALRAATSLVIAPVGQFPAAIFGINVVGAFVLGLLLQTLALRGPDVGSRRIIRLLVGTGVLGGFTTYSALSADSATLLSEGGIGIALIYGAATVIVGGLASWLGIALGSRFGTRDGGRDSTPASGQPGQTGQPGEGTR